MAENKYYLQSEEMIQLPKRSVQRLLQSRDPNAALLYLYLANTNGVVKEENIRALLHLESSEIEEALKTLLRLNLISKEGFAAVQNEERSVYSQQEVAEGLQSDEEFHTLVNETEKLLGKFLTPAELNLLYAMYHELLLPADVLIMVVNRCVQETQRKLGSGRVPTVRAIEREARIWAKDGVNDIFRADQYLKAKDQYRDQLHQMMRVLQIYGRKLTKTEEDYLKKFIDMKFTPEAVYLAYDITMIRTGGLKWGYMAGILRKWHEKGLHQADEIQAYEKEHPMIADNTPKEETELGEDEKASLKWLKQYGTKKREDFES